MKIYNKLSATLLLLCISSQPLYALTFSQPDIQSSENQLLYVEVPYSGANNNQNLSASLANNDDLIKIGISPTQNLGDLNFFVRRTSVEDGVIVITSSHPIQEKDLKIVFRVKDGDALHLQQVETSLNGQLNEKTLPLKKNEQVLIPQQLTQEQEQALNLPESQAYAPQPPVLSVKQTKQVTAPERVSTTKPKQQRNTTHTNSYTVKSQDSLWSIASKISAQTHRPLAQVLQELKDLNQNAFVNGNFNRIRQGATLKVSAPLPKDKPKAKAAVTATPVVRRTDQAQMHLVGEKESAHNGQASPELTKELHATQQKTQTLKSNVHQLDQGLKAKEVKIDLLNSKLAQLQQQLKEHNRTKTSH